MRPSIAAAGVVLAVLVFPAASAQTPGPEADPGVRPTRLIGALALELAALGSPWTR